MVINVLLANTLIHGPIENEGQVSFDVQLCLVRHFCFFLDYEVGSSSFDSTDDARSGIRR